MLGVSYGKDITLRLKSIKLPQLLEWKGSKERRLTLRKHLRHAEIHTYDVVCGSLWVCIMCMISARGLNPNAP